jgi:hypothetical protein
MHTAVGRHRQRRCAGALTGVGTASSGGPRELELHADSLPHPTGSWQFCHKAASGT